MNCQGVDKIEQIQREWYCHTLAMTTKTIPEYLEDERQKGRDAQQSIEEEASRIQPLNHGHHRTTKQPKLELRSTVKAVPIARNKSVSLKETRSARKTASKVRRAA